MEEASVAKLIDVPSCNANATDWRHMSRIEDSRRTDYRLLDPRQADRFRVQKPKERGPPSRPFFYFRKTSACGY